MAQEVSVSTLIKSTRRIRENWILFICTTLAVAVIWRAVNIADLPTAYLSIALAICLVLTGIALVDCRKSAPSSDNA